MKRLVYAATIVVLVIGAVAVGRFEVADAQNGKFADQQSRPEGAPACTPPPSGIVAWYRGEDNGLDVFSLNDATLQNGAGYTAGKVGRGFDFDGVDDIAVVSDSPSLAFGTNSFTIETWARVDSTNNYSALFTKRAETGGFDGIIFFREPTGILGAHIASGGLAAISSDAPMQIGQLYHLALVVDRTSGTAKMYVDGVLQTSQPSLAGVGSLTNTEPLRIGRVVNSTANPNPALAFDGLIDELTIYNGALTTAEIQAIYNANTAGKCLYCTPTPVGLVSWYQAENNTDDVRSRINGTLQGGMGYAPGKIGQAFNFDGVDDSVDIGGNFNNQNFSLSLWVRPGATQVEYADIVDNNHSGASNWVIQQNANSTNQYFFAGIGFSLTANVWQHLTLTHTDGNMSYAYINGVLVASGPAAISYNGSQFLRLGRWGGGGRNWNGQLDEFATFNRTLTPLEIRAMYQSGGNGMCKPTATSPPGGVVGWWGGDGDAFDISGNGNNGTLNNGAKFAVGKVGQAFDLDGVDDFIQTDLDIQPSAIPNVTFEAWVFPRNPTGADQAILSGDDGGWDRQIGISPSGATFRAQTGTATTFDAASVDYNQWQHVAVVYTPSNIKIYKNGVEYDFGAAPTGQNSVNKLAIGSNRCPPCVGNSATQQFVGMIDEASVYSRALTPAEINSIYNAGIAGKLTAATTITTTNLVSAWRGEGNALDTIGNNNGSLNGGTLFAGGELGQAFALDGINDTVTVADSPSLNFAANGPITVEMWAYRTSTNAIQHLIGKRNNCDGSPINYQIAYAANQVLFGSAGNEVGSGVDLPLNKWTHVAGTFDGSTLRIYINGSLAGSVAGSLGAATATPLLIGGSGTCATFGGALDEVAIYSRALSATEIQAQFGAKSAIATGVGDVTVRFQSVTATGTTQEIPLDPAVLPPMPAGVGSLGLTYDIDTSAAFTGNVDLCFNVPALLSTTAANLRVLHMENGAWVDRTANGATHSALCTTGLTSLSPFAIGFRVPTAANASIAGRAITANGQGIRNAVITLTDSTGHTQNARTGSFGYYKFDDVTAGETYVLSIQSKRFTFANATRVISVSDDVTDADFIAIE